MPVIESFCTICSSVAAHEQPPCGDGHATDCPEYACVHCGGAILVGPWPLPLTGKRIRLPHPVRPRRAA